MSEGVAQPELTPEMESVLERYLDIQTQERVLREEKAELQEKLKAHLAGAPGTYWQVTVAGQNLRIRHVDTTEIRYDEKKLRTRLGDRYTAILAPDWRKVRKQIKDLTPYLEPVLDRIGTPDRDKVRAAVDAGTVSADDFVGAFEKETVTRIAVIRERTRPEREQQSGEPAQP